MTFHAQAESLQALQDQEGAVRCQRRAGVAQRHHAAATDVSGRAERLGVDHAVIGGVRFVEHREAGLVGDPVKLARIDNRAADGGAVTADVFGQRMDDDIRAMLEGLAQIRGGDRVVDDQRHAVLVRDLGQLLQIDHVARRVADGLAEQRAGLVIDQRFHLVEIVERGHPHIHALAREGVGEQVVGAAVQLAGADDVVTGLADALNRVGDRRHARGKTQCGNAAFHRRDALLQHIGGRVHDAGVDVAGDFQVEQVGPVLGVIKGVRGGLVDRHRGGLGGRFGFITVVQGQRFEFHGAPPDGMFIVCSHKERSLSAQAVCLVSPKHRQSRAAIQAP